MNIFIAFDHKNTPLGLLLATNKDFAQVAFDAMGASPHTIEEVDPDNLPVGANVFYLLTSKPVSGFPGMRKWIRGR